MTQKYTGKKNWLVELIGEKVAISFLDGKKMTGKIIDVTAYDIILVNKKIENPIVILKHSVKYVYKLSDKQED
ncbi:hypothetical protein P7H60_14685 [Vagococcus carniphilus]|uniref:hypothetical protein n=1 Tax=Vagococcus carniphilus TaxID=218144 RepID=UPI00288E9340|nr:hypothetical protein [Vagococcus carniphilus]MDT2850398.1 hypothetical protein [Vagococcus carniphilus]